MHIDGKGCIVIYIQVVSGITWLEKVNNSFTTLWPHVLILLTDVGEGRADRLQQKSGHLRTTAWYSSPGQHCDQLLHCAYHHDCGCNFYSGYTQFSCSIQPAIMIVGARSVLARIRSGLIILQKRTAFLKRVMVLTITRINSQCLKIVYSIMMYVSVELIIELYRIFSENLFTTFDFIEWNITCICCVNCR